MNYILKYLVLYFSSSFLDGVKGKCPYTYHDDGWFRFQEMPMKWYDALVFCELEGSMLASPITAKFTNIMKGAITEGDIFTGIHSLYSKAEYYSLEGTPLYKMPHKWAKSEPDNKGNTERCIALDPEGNMSVVACDEPRPFMCYKKNVGNICGTSNSDYKYNERTKKCYKFHPVARQFYQAQFVCSAEGGHLAIINSAEESKVIVDIFKGYPSSKIIGSYLNHYALVGFHRLEHNKNWMTMDGQTLQGAGFSKFAPGEPNNRNGPEDCGSVTLNGLLNDMLCDKKIAFICEKDPHCPLPCSDYVKNSACSLLSGKST